jgi:hypothetical protein
MNRPNSTFARKGNPAEDVLGHAPGNPNALENIAQWSCEPQPHTTGNEITGDADEAIAGESRSTNKFCQYQICGLRSKKKMKDHAHAASGWRLKNLDRGGAGMKPVTRENENLRAEPRQFYNVWSKWGK